MEALLASLLIAQGFNPQEAAENPAMIYRLGAFMGTHVCRFFPFGRTINTTSWMASEHYLENFDHEAPGLFQYVLNLPDDHPTKKAYTYGLSDQLYYECPQIFLAPEK